MLFARDSAHGDDSSYNAGMVNAIISILVVIILAFCCLAGYAVSRRRRRAKKGMLLPTHRKSSHHRQLSMATDMDAPSSSFYVCDEKRNLVSSVPSLPPSSVPEIRITFPDDEGVSEKGGRVVVVNVGDSGTVGMRPLKEEALPPYSSSEHERFQSLDLDRIGGLKDKREEPKR